METRNINPTTWQDTFAYSQAVEVTGAERVLYCAGQVAIDRDGQPQHPGDLRAQLEMAFDNLESVLVASGYGLNHVVRLNIFTCDMEATLANYDVVVRRLKSAGVQPANTVVGVSRLALPQLLIEIEATAVR